MQGSLPRRRVGTRRKVRIQRPRRPLSRAIGILLKRADWEVDDKSEDYSANRCIRMFAVDVANDTAKDPFWRRDIVAMALLVLIVFVGYFARPTVMSMRGEEARRAQVAVEIIESGDWVVPREQGDPFMSRPPLQNWLIAFCYIVTGERDCFGARLPSLVSVLLMTLLIYGYGRTFLTPIGALASATAYATFGEVMQECRMAETEALFALLVSGSIMLWHLGMIRGWPDVVSWSIGYGLMALGMLAKSLQAPVYFLGPVLVYLVFTRQWRRLFSFSHVAGMLVGAGILAAWVIPYAQQLGIDSVKNIWLNDMRTRIFEWDGVLIHFFQFPAELLGCTLPWSPLLLAYFGRQIRASIGPARPQMLFMTAVVVLGFPSVWLPPNGMTRYLIPLYPCLAVLCGFVVQRISESAIDSALANGWRRYLLGWAVLMVLAGIAISATGWFRDYPIIGVWAETPVVTMVFLAIFLGLACATYRFASAASLSWRAGAGVVALGLFMGVAFTGPITNARIRRGNDVGAEIVKLKSELPADVQLVSLGHIHSELPFFYGQAVKALPLSESGARAVPEGAYFCFNTHGANRPQLPFEWREVKVIAVDRNKRPIPEDVLIIAKRGQ